MASFVNLGDNEFGAVVVDKVEGTSVFEVEFEFTLDEGLVELFEDDDEFSVEVAILIILLVKIKKILNKTIFKNLKLKDV